MIEAAAESLSADARRADDRAAGAPGDAGEATRRATAATGLIGVALATALLLAAAPRLLNDPDTLWHVRIGAEFLDTRQLPTTDAWSHTFLGEPWIAKEWLSQALFAAAHRLAGWPGVSGLTIAALVAAFALVQRALSRELAPLPAFAIAFWAFAMSSGAFLARPHALALPVALWLIDDVWRRARSGRRPSLAALAAVAVWANLHGSVTIGLLAIAAAAGHAVFDGRRIGLDAPGAILRDRRARSWIMFAGAAPLAACIHPYGIEALLSTLIVAATPATAHIMEWRSFTIDGEPAMAAHLAAAALVLLTGRFRAPFFAAAFVVASLAAYLAHVRFAYLLLMGAPIVLAPDIAAALQAVSRARSRAQPPDGLERLLARTGPRAQAVFLALAAVAGAACLWRTSPAPPPRIHPQAAIAAARDAGPPGPVLNAYNFGGALIFEGVPTFLDGRTDRLFDEGRFFAEVMENIGSEAALDGYIADYGIGWTLLEPGHPFDAMLAARPDWSLLYADEFAIVRVRSR